MNIDKLRNDLINYFGTAMMNGFAIAIMDLVMIEKASDDEIIQIAYENGFDLGDYVVLSK